MGSCQPRDRTRISCTAGRFFSIEPPGKPGCHSIITLTIQAPFRGLQASTACTFPPAGYVVVFSRWSKEKFRNYTLNPKSHSQPTQSQTGPRSAKLRFPKPSGTWLGLKSTLSDCKAGRASVCSHGAESCELPMRP